MRKKNRNTYHPKYRARSYRRTRNRASTHTIKSSASPSKWIISLRCLEALAAIAAIFAIGVWFFVERPAIKEQRNLNAEQIEIFKSESYMRNKSVLLNPTAYKQDRQEAFQEIVKTGVMKNVNFSGKNINPIQFFKTCNPGLILHNVDFSGADMSKACFEHMILKDVTFLGTTLTEANFSNSEIDNSKILNDVDISNANFTNAHFLTWAYRLNPNKTCWVWEESQDSPINPLGAENALRCRKISNRLKPIWSELHPFYYAYYYPDGPTYYQHTSARFITDSGRTILNDPLSKQNRLKNLETDINSDFLLNVYEGSPNPNDLGTHKDYYSTIKEFETLRESLRDQDALTLPPQKADLELRGLVITTGSKPR